MRGVGGWVVAVGGELNVANKNIHDWARAKAQRVCLHKHRHTCTRSDGSKNQEAFEDLSAHIAREELELITGFLYPP